MVFSLACDRWKWRSSFRSVIFWAYREDRTNSSSSQTCAEVNWGPPESCLWSGKTRSYGIRCLTISNLKVSRSFSNSMFSFLKSYNLDYSAGILCRLVTISVHRQIVFDHEWDESLAGQQMMGLENSFCKRNIDLREDRESAPMPIYVRRPKMGGYTE